MISLVGPRGAGKTSIGRILASRMGRPFLDLDEEIERETKRPISQLFEDSETNFRDLEEDLLRRIVTGGPPELVFSPGGGAILRTRSRSLLARSLCIYLRANAATLRARLAADPNRRPPLLGLNALDEVDEVLDARDRVYRAAADLTFETDGRTSEEVATGLLAAWAPFQETEKRKLSATPPL